MINYEIVRMPTDNDELQAMLVELQPFLDGMYTEADEKIFGPLNFILEHWLFLWDNDTGYFLVGRDQNKEIKVVGMLTQYKDLWHSRQRLDIHRLITTQDMDAKEVMEGSIAYLKSVAPLLRVSLMFYCTRDDKGNEVKELIWNNKV